MPGALPPRSIFSEKNDTISALSNQAQLPGNRPLLVFDGDCGFCRRSVLRWRRLTGERIDHAPSQEVAGRFPQIPPERFRDAVILVEPDGTWLEGAAAIFRSLQLAGRWRWLHAAYRRVPAFARIAEAVYGWVASHRTGVSRLTRLVFGSGDPPTYYLTRRLFLRGLGLVYLFAFLSLAVQIDGLVGSNGILPAGEYMDHVARQVEDRQLGADGYRLVPTLCWYDAGDGFLALLCWGGALMALLVLAGIFPWPLLLALWVAYLSLAVVGQIFLGYQWDALLLETGLLAVFLAPLRPWPNLRKEAPPSPAVLWLIRWLLFRLLLASGLVKLVGDRPTWESLTALTYHYETQPIPTWTAWYAHQLPLWFQKFSTVLMFGIELLVPFLILLPRRFRRLAFLPLILLQLLIAGTGNYGFFNVLTVVLCITLLDDGILQRFYPRRLRGRIPDHDRPARLRRVFLAPAAALLFVLSTTAFAFQFTEGSLVPGFARDLHTWAQPFRSFNRYGLFARMTTSRPEIVVEGSNDGRNWKAYRFRWKPGDPLRPPRFAGPHMPRLDWQMWFAALRGSRRAPWFHHFVARLQEGSPEVLALLDDDPFRGEPPLHIRGMLFDYRFTDAATRRTEDAWWQRRALGLYSPVVTRRRP